MATSYGNPVAQSSFLKSLIGSIGGTPAQNEVLAEIEPRHSLLGWAAEAGGHWLGMSLAYQPAKSQWLEGQIQELASLKRREGGAEDEEVMSKLQDCERVLRGRQSRK